MPSPLMQADHLRVVRNTWVRLQGTYKVEDLGAMTFSHFFQQHPGAAALFPQLGAGNLDNSAELQQLSTSFMQALNPVLTEDHKLDALADAAHACGCAVARFGVRADQLEDVFACLRDVMAEVLDKRWSSEMDEVWGSVSSGLLHVLEPAVSLALIDFPTTDPQYLELEVPSKESQEALKASWGLVKGRTRSVGIQMFNKMFKMAPTTRELCHALLATPEGSDTPLLAQHGETFMDQLGFCTTRLAWKETAIPYLIWVAEGQANTFELEIEHMVFFGKALLFALKEGIGSAWTGAIEDAWRDFWLLIHDVMKLVIGRRRESAQRKKMRELGSIYSPHRESDVPKRTAKLVATEAEYRDLVASAAQEREGREKAKSPRHGSRFFVPPTSTSTAPPPRPATASPAPAVAARPAPPVGSPIGAAGLHAPPTPEGAPPSTPPVAPPPKVTEDRSSSAPSDASSASRRDALKPATFHFAGTCTLHRLLPSGDLEQVNPPDAYTPEGLLGVVLLSHGEAARSILVYNKKKQQSFAAEVTSDGVDIFEDKPFSFRVGAGAQCHVITFRSVADQVKFGTQLSIAKSMLWEGADGPMVRQDIVAGKGRRVRQGDTVSVRFTAFAEESRGSPGAMFDGNVAEGAPALTFTVGSDQVLAGLEAGAVGMAQGGIRRLVVPPGMGYGAEGVADVVPPNSVLHIELTVESLGGDGGGAPPPAPRSDEEGNKDDNTNGSSTVSGEATVTPVFHYARVCTLYQQSPSGGWELVQFPDAYNEGGQLGLIIVSSGSAERKVVIYDKNKQAVVQAALDAREATCALSPDTENAFLLEADGKAYQLVLKNEAEACKFAVQVALARSAAAGMAPGAKDAEPDLVVQDMVRGSGSAAEAGNVVKIRYQGWLEGEGGRGTIGPVFDGNMGGSADLLEFTIGCGQVVQGLEDGVVGMRCGGRRHLVVPPRMGYGAAGVAGHVPRNSVIHLELELFERAPAPEDHANSLEGGGHGASREGSLGSSHLAAGLHDDSTGGEAASESDRGSNANSRQRTSYLQVQSSLSMNTTGAVDSPQLGNSAKGKWPMHQDTFSTNLASVGGTFATLAGSSGRGTRAGEGESESGRGVEGPVFHLVSTCHALKYVEGGFAPLQLPGYGADKSLGYAVISPGEGQNRKLVVYAPVFQADLGGGGGSVQQADPSVGIENCYRVSDEGGSEWLVVLKGTEQSARFERHVDVGSPRRASPQRGGGGDVDEPLGGVQVTIPAAAGAVAAKD